MTSRELAKVIYSIERDRKMMREFCLNDNKYKLENISIELSEDCMVFHLWRRYPDQVRRFWKCVPAGRYTVDEIEEFLDIQKWLCI